MLARDRRLQQHGQWSAEVHLQVAFVFAGRGLRPGPWPAGVKCFKDGDDGRRASASQLAPGFVQDQRKRRDANREPSAIRGQQKSARATWRGV